MKIAICGSMAHQERMDSIGERLRIKGYEVETPIAKEAGAYIGEVAAGALQKKSYIDQHFAKINASDAILVVNEDKNGIANYIGGNTLIEMSHAYAQGLEIFLLNPVPVIGYADEIQGMHPIVLNGSLEALDTYVESLPLVYMSTTSNPKQSAVSRAMRRAGVPVRIEGEKFDSGVSEQPMTMQETYEGAVNRHKMLIDSGIKAEYYCTIESGFESIHTNHNLFGCSVVVLQKAGEDIEVGVEVDLEFPQEIFDEVPSKYADVGVLIQQKYNSVHKDAYPFLTDGKLTRREILENAVYGLAVRKKELR